MDSPGGELVVRWVRSDAIGVGGREFDHSFAVSPAGLLDPWPVASVEALDAAGLDQLLAPAPDLILLGTGERQRQLPQALLYRALARGIGVEVMTNAAAARTYHLLLGEGRKVLAAFILPG